MDSASGSEGYAASLSDLGDPDMDQAQDIDPLGLDELSGDEDDTDISDDEWLMEEDPDNPYAPPPPLPAQEPILPPEPEPVHYPGGYHPGVPQPPGLNE